ncbi:unnamed protein product [Ranitomeya imitator]|uniref:Caspase family p20 domain-containing protein n=1 Tax=Ranitomeya imitator TaxID=111125 RepID=A0ABN9KVV6_9NEOB|nr:unnamed protein product [Ranitomeya imitator]
MLKSIKNYAKEDHTGRDSVVCFVLSHGDKGIVFGTDGKKVSVKELTDCFNGQNCPSLVGKPKVFFIQACQGDQSDTGVTYVSDSKEVVFVTDANGGRLPITADFLTAFACFEDYESLRNQTTGSVYIQMLCTVLQDNQFFFNISVGFHTIHNLRFPCTLPYTFKWVPGSYHSIRYHSVLHVKLYNVFPSSASPQTRGHLPMK